jgi:quercetin dioxygenase-like cupin family protein
MSNFALRHISMAIAIATISALGAKQSIAQTQSPKKFNASTLQQVSLGQLPPGKWDMKATMLVIEAGGEVPFHVHKGPGLRYVLDGAITINWKGGKTETFKAGATYFEGAGENHPSGNFSARNNGSEPCRVVIVELVPEE